MKKMLNDIRFYNYRPLVIIILIIVISSYSISRNCDGNHFSQNFMGLFFVIFSIFKLVDIKAFTKAFRKYDILTQKLELYGSIYPFIELSLGVLYLGNKNIDTVNILTFVLMSFNTYSVVKSIRSGIDIKCACLGKILDVPLSIVSLTENLLMSLMSIYMVLS